MFKQADEFYSWWVYGILRNWEKIKRVYIYQDREKIREAILEGDDIFVKDKKVELREAKETKVLIPKTKDKLKKDGLKGIFFLNLNLGGETIEKIDYFIILNWIFLESQQARVKPRVLSVFKNENDLSPYFDQVSKVMKKISFHMTDWNEITDILDNEDEK